MTLPFLQIQILLLKLKYLLLQCIVTVVLIYLINSIIYKIVVKNWTSLLTTSVSLGKCWKFSCGHFHWLSSVTALSSWFWLCRYFWLTHSTLHFRWTTLSRCRSIYSVSPLQEISGAFFPCLFLLFLYCCRFWRLFSLLKTSLDKDAGFLCIWCLGQLLRNGLFYEHNIDLLQFWL